MTLLAHLRLVAVAIVLFGIVLSAPALAQKLGPDGAPNPTASVVDEATLLKQAPRIEGRIDIPDIRASVLIQPAGRTWAYFHEVLLHRGGAIVILGMIAVLAAAYLIMGPLRITAGRSGRKIIRFKAFERFSHWLTAISFVALGLTGLNITFGKMLLLPVVGPDAFSNISQAAKYVHNFTGFSFVAGLVLIIVIFFKSSRVAVLLKTNTLPPAASILARNLSIGFLSLRASRSPYPGFCCCFLFLEPISPRCSWRRSSMPSWPSCSSP